MEVEDCATFAGYRHIVEAISPDSAQVAWYPITQKVSCCQSYVCRRREQVDCTKTTSVNVLGGWRFYLVGQMTVSSFPSAPSRIPYHGVSGCFCVNIFRENDGCTAGIRQGKLELRNLGPYCPCSGSRFYPRLGLASEDVLVWCGDGSLTGVACSETGRLAIIHCDKMQTLTRRQCGMLCKSKQGCCQTVDLLLREFRRIIPPPHGAPSTFRGRMSHR